ncbi:hypothetical protein TNCV_4763701 [Trichonephila clavipes]|nr:hypothetical protein TNCV_4763701 [Trichonephila clavipes]
MGEKLNTFRSACAAFCLAGVARLVGRCQGSHEGVNEGGRFSERTLEVDDPGLKKERRERWPSRDPPTRCSRERRVGHSQHRCT